MTRRFLIWLSRLLEGPKAAEYLTLPVFYTVIDGAGRALETTRSIHRARGIAREMKANGHEGVAIATYTADSITREF